MQNAVTKEWGNEGEGESQWVSGDGGVVFRAASISELGLLSSSHQQTPGRVAVRSEEQHQNDVARC
jgi:hypothetical protein